MGEIGGTSEEDGSGVNRRRLLKGAVATGVGVAAWSAPSITSLGGSPVYAGVCTQPIFDYEVGSRNTSCDCESGTQKYINYKLLKDPCGGGSTPPVTVVLKHGGCGGSNVGNNGTCAPGTTKQGSGTAGDTYVCIGSNTSGLFCRVKVTVELGNCSGSVVATAFSGSVGPAGGSSPMPAVECTGAALTSSNLFVRTTLQCSIDPDCV